MQRGSASVLAISVGTVGSLIVARVLQALGASAGLVASRAIIRDLFDRNRAAAMIGLVATVMVVVPTFAPLAGGLLETGFIKGLAHITGGGLVDNPPRILPDGTALRIQLGSWPWFSVSLTDNDADRN